jgi:hypothetical protein
MMTLRRKSRSDAARRVDLQSKQPGYLQQHDINEAKAYLPRNLVS